MKSNIAIIPARGGSKRIPKKNIVEFHQKPLIAWTIEAALNSGLFDAVVVSTDDEEIAKISIQWGAEVPFLRSNAADDHSPVSLATLSTIIDLEKCGRKFDNVVQLFAVCPLRTSENIIDAFEYFTRNNLNFLISSSEFSIMNPWWAVTLDEKNVPKSIFENKKFVRSQDLPKLFSPTGAVWIANIEKLKEQETFYGLDHRFYNIDWKNAIDIDNFEDLELARTLFLLNNS